MTVSDRTVEMDFHQSQLTVILDTNILHLQNAHDVKWSEFRTINDYYECALLIPQVVLYELVSLRLDQIVSRAKEIKSTARAFERLLKGANALVEGFGLHSFGAFASASFDTRYDSDRLFDGNWDTFTDAISKELAALLGQPVIEAEWPSLSHEFIVRRCSLRKAPFHLIKEEIDSDLAEPSQHQASKKLLDRKGKDKGYKDYLVWLTVLETLRESSAEVVFITADKGFYEASLLHSDLAADLNSFGIDQNRLKMFRSLERFNDQYIKSRNTLDAQFALLAQTDLFRKLAEHIAVRKEEFLDSLKDKVRAMTIGQRNWGEITGGKPVLLRSGESRRRPGDTFSLACDVAALYQTREWSIDTERGFSIPTDVITSVGLEYPCEMIVTHDGDILAVTPTAENARTTDLVDCQVEIGGIEANDLRTIDVFASSPLSQPEAQSRKVSDEDIRLILSDFGCEEANRLSESGLLIECIHNVPVPIIEKWGFKAPKARYMGD